MKARAGSALVVTISLLVICGTASADSVTLSDGTVIFGVIKSLGNGKLTLETEFVGTVTVDASAVMSIQSDQPLSVALSSGDRLIGTIEPSADGEGFVVKTRHADVPIKSSDVQDMWTEGGQSPEAKTLEEAIAKHQAKWSSQIEIGGVMREGNTDSLDVRGAFELKRTTENDALKFHIRANYAEQNDIASSNEVRGGVDYEYWFTKRWSWYARMELEYDEFENLDLRSTVAGGLGYTWVKRDHVNLKTRAGVGYVHESFSNGMTDNNAVIDLGLAFRWDVVEWVRLTHDATYSPTWDDTADYRLRFDSALTFPLGDSKLWKFKVGMLNEYDSMPELGVERLDNTWYTSFVLDVK